MTLDTVVDESRETIADCSRDWKLRYDGRIEYNLLASVPFFLSSLVLPFPGMFLVFVFLPLCSICYSAASSSCSFFLCHLHPASFRNAFVHILCLIPFRSTYFLGGVFCCALVPGTLAFDLSTLVLS